MGGMSSCQGEENSGCVYFLITDSACVSISDFLNQNRCRIATVRTFIGKYKVDICWNTYVAARIASIFGGGGDLEWGYAVSNSILLFTICFLLCCFVGRLFVETLEMALPG